MAVSSGAIAAGLPVLGLGDARPRDPVTLQAVSAVGQSRLMGVWDRHLAGHGLVGGQVLLAPLDFAVRDQYLHARATLAALLELGVVPIVNENDAIADDEIRFGDNDRIAALVAHLVGAELLVLLTDIAGVLTADPRFDSSASLIEEILEVDHHLEALAGGAGTARGSGGMATKLAAAKIASWSGVRTVIAAADRPGRGGRRPGRRGGVGTVVRPRARRLTARKLWIAFAVGLDRAPSWSTPGPAGPSRPTGGRCCRPGWSGPRAGSAAGEAVEVADDDGRGVRQGHRRARRGHAAGRRRRPHRAPCPRAPPTRSSTATTSSSSPGRPRPPF